MKKILIVVDMQNDFIDGALGTKEAVAILPAAVKKIKEWEGDIFVTLDTHFENYMNTGEGKKLPVPHCIKGSEGWKLNKDIASALEGRRYTVVEKNTFGSKDLPGLIGKSGTDFSAELIGLCTDICVISNALLLKAFYPENEITVDLSCCAGVSKERHDAAAEILNSCQIV